MHKIRFGKSFFRIKSMKYIQNVTIEYLIEKYSIFDRFI